MLVGEPDVHLHPDLQHRLMELVVKATADTQVMTLIATHSTAILGGLSAAAEAKVAFMHKDAAELDFRPMSDALRQILPVFGAHPLSNVFNQNPVLLGEGDDDVRIWQQAVRSSNGRIKLWPCPAGDKQSLSRHETTAAEIIGSVYDNARAYSLRDKDDRPYEIKRPRTRNTHEARLQDSREPNSLRRGAHKTWDELGRTQAANTVMA